jgi:hypothetical protein
VIHISGQQARIRITLVPPLYYCCLVLHKCAKDRCRKVCLVESKINHLSDDKQTVSCYYENVTVTEPFLNEDDLCAG